MAQMQQPRIAEIVAAMLRDKILSGQLRDGDDLPRQEILLEEFSVSKPSLREALRILESQGMITVRRGNQGGATVHVPREQNAAYMIGLVLQVRDVPYTDVGAALKLIEPVCTGLVAARKDRRRAVLPRLRAIHEDSKKAMDDPEMFTRLSRAFHEAIVEECGNQTLILVVGALETLYTGQWQSWAVEAASEGQFPDGEGRQAGIRAHDRILKAVEQGDTTKAEQAARRHLEASQLYTVGGKFDRRAGNSEFVAGLPLRAPASTTLPADPQRRVSDGQGGRR